MYDTFYPASQQWSKTSNPVNYDSRPRSFNQGPKESEPTIIISYQQLRKNSHRTDEISSYSENCTSMHSSMSYSVYCTDVTHQLKERKKGISTTVLELFDVSLRALCAVSSFQKLLEERLWTVPAREKSLLEKTNLKEFTELLLLNKIKEECSFREYLDPMEFLVKVFSTLDSLEEAQHEGRTTFSICAKDFIKCTDCNSWMRSSLNLGALHPLSANIFSISDYEKSYFNPESQEKVKMQNEEGEKKCLITCGTASLESNLQQFLINSSSRLDHEYTKCENCKFSTSQIKVSELHSLSAGLIIVLPENSAFTNVPKRLNLRACPAANAVYQFKAAVLRNSNRDREWMCAENLSQLSERFSGPRLLFYERTSQFQVSKETRISVKDGLNFIKTLKHALQTMQSYKDRKVYVALQLWKQAIPVRKKEKQPLTCYSNPPQCSMNRDTLWECRGHTAGLEAALKGLFTIKGFSEFFEPDCLIPTQNSSFYSCLKVIYDIHKQQLPLAKHLESLQDGESWPHCWINLLLSECAKSVFIEKRDDQYYGESSQQRSNRKGSEVLRNMFPILKEEQSYSQQKYTTPTCSCILDIPLKLQDIAVRRPPNKQCMRANLTTLEYCLSELLNPKSAGYSQEENQQFIMRYLGSALIIRLFEENSTRARVQVPKTLDMRQFDERMEKIYQLRAIIQLPESQERKDFTVLEINDTGETSELSKEGVSAYMLFFEQIESGKGQLVIQSDSSEKKIVSERKKIYFRFGLQNLGATCFMNAALNGLYSLPSFRSFFITQKNQNRLLCALTEFCENYTQREVPLDLLYEFREAIIEFRDGRQHCANSYIFKLLMLLDTLLPTPPTTTFPQDIFGNKMRQYRKGKCEQLHDIFGTLAENLFICIKCSHTRRNFSYFRTVDVPIPYYEKTFGEVTMFSPNNFYPGRSAKVYTGTEFSEAEYIQKFSQISQELPVFKSAKTLSQTELSQCFKYMLRASLMSPQSLMQCDNCGFETQHYKQTFFRQLSTTFVVHLQRFDERTGRKLNTTIGFPMNLDMSDYCLNDPRKYQLCGVVYHIGSLNTGHYYSRIKVEERWYEVDDTYVREMECEPSSENAYMLFYEQVKI